MINLGFYPASDISGIRPRVQFFDRVMEYLAVGLVLVLGVLTLTYYSELPEGVLAKCWVGFGVPVVLAAFGWCIRYMPINFYRFPVRITEHNADLQFSLASRACRVLMIMGILYFFFRQLGMFAEYAWQMDKELFLKLSVGSLAGLFLTLIVYYIFVAVYYYRGR